MRKLSAPGPPLHSEARLLAAAGSGAEGRITFRCLVAWVVLVLPTLAWHQESSAKQSHPSDDYTINVNVDVVVLHATAQDRKGTLVSGLAKDYFQVYEDGVL